MQNWHWLATKLTHQALTSYSQSFNLNQAHSLNELIVAIAKNGFWHIDEQSFIVCRACTDGAYIAICTTESSQDHLSEINSQLQSLDTSLQQIQYLDSTQCLDLTKSLAKIIKQTVPENILKNSQVVAIPRGGLFIQAMLSYFLPLKHHQLQYTENDVDTSPLIIVDDCAISGLRLAQQLEKFPNRDIYFFTIASPEKLRDSVKLKEARVLDFKSVVNIKSYSTLKAQNTQQRYWLGQCDAVIFPWSETQRSHFSNGKLSNRPLWKIAPDKLCMSTKAKKQAIKATEVKENQSAVLSTPDNILHFTDQGITKILDASTMKHYSLDAIGSDIWQSLLSNSNLDHALAELSATYKVSKTRLNNDMQLLTQKLIDAGLINELKHA